MNQTLREIHDTLLKEHDALSKQLGQTTDPSTAGMLLTEMKEILHRIDLVQGLLFRESSAALESMMPDIQEADERLSEAVADLTDSAEFLKSAAGFLKFVDQAIDIAKTLGPLAG